MYGVLYDDLSSMTFSFFFSPLFSILPSKFTLTIQTFIIVFSFINISVLFLIVFFIFFCFWPICQFFFKKFDHWIHNYNMLFFQIQTSFFWFFFVLDYFMNLNFLFYSPLQFKILSSPLIYFLFQSRSLFSLLLFFFILLYNWYIFLV